MSADGRPQQAILNLPQQDNTLLLWCPDLDFSFIDPNFFCQVAKPKCANNELVIENVKKNLSRCESRRPTSGMDPSHKKA